MRSKEDILPECPVATTVSLIGSKWKLLIMRPNIKSMERWGLAYKCRGFNSSSLQIP